MILRISRGINLIFVAFTQNLLAASQKSNLTEPLSGRIDGFITVYTYTVLKYFVHILEFILYYI